MASSLHIDELGRKTCPESPLGFCHQRKADTVSSEDAAAALSGYGQKYPTNQIGKFF
jgi:hypothetical protein